MAVDSGSGNAELCQTWKQWGSWGRGEWQKGQVKCGVCDRKGCEMKCLGGGGTEARHGCSRSWVCGRQEVTAM